jgi:hypothetical protein
LRECRESRVMKTFRWKRFQRKRFQRKRERWKRLL